MSRPAHHWTESAREAAQTGEFKRYTIPDRPKEAAIRGFGLPLAEGLRIEAGCFNRSIHDPATAEGLRRFRERDHPDRRHDQLPRTPGLTRDKSRDDGTV